VDNNLIISSHGTAFAVMLAVCSSSPGQTRLAWLGASALLGIVASSLRMVRRRDSKQCHTPASKATPVTQSNNARSSA
jgi:hypothetical protein